MEKLKVAVIGLGAMGKHHIRVFNQMENVELVGVADVNETLNTSDIVRFYIDYKEMLRREKPDAVSIAVPTSKHREVAIYCIKKGVHCLIEKPIAANLKDAKEILNCAKKYKVKLAIGHIENFNPAVLRLKKMLSNRLLGEILSITARRVGPFASRISDVGIILDLATHDLGVIMELTGKEPISILSKWKGIKNKKGDYAFITGEISDKVLFCLEINWHTPKKTRILIVTGTKGTAYLDYIKQKLTVHTPGWEMVPDIEKEEPLKLELENFIGCINENESPHIDGNKSYGILKWALKAEENKKE